MMAPVVVAQLARSEMGMLALMLHQMEAALVVAKVTQPREVPVESAPAALVAPARQVLNGKVRRLRAQAAAAQEDMALVQRAMGEALEEITEPAAAAEPFNPLLHTPQVAMALKVSLSSPTHPFGQSSARAWSNSGEGSSDKRAAKWPSGMSVLLLVLEALRPL